MADDPTPLDKLKDLRDEIQRLKQRQREESKSAASLQQGIDELTRLRNDELTNHAVHGDQRSHKRASELADQIADQRQELADATAIVEGIATRLKPLETQVKALETEVQSQLGALLNEKMAAAAGTYNEAAPSLVPLLVEMAAIQRLMIRCMTGNSNLFGWEATLIPKLVPGSGKSHEPFADARDMKFRHLTSERIDELVRELRGQGFSIR
jgi:hypothetical protein